jgi:hypothetical protein
MDLFCRLGREEERHCSKRGPLRESSALERSARRNLAAPQARPVDGGSRIIALITSASEVHRQPPERTKAAQQNGTQRCGPAPRSLEDPGWSVERQSARNSYLFCERRKTTDKCRRDLKTHRYFGTPFLVPYSHTFGRKSGVGLPVRIKRPEIGGRIRTFFGSLVDAASVHSVDVTEEVLHRSFDVRWAMPSVASAIFLKAWNSPALIPVSGRNCGHTAKDVAFGDSASTMAGDRRERPTRLRFGNRQRNGVETCSPGEAHSRFLGARGSERPFFNGRWPRRRKADLYRPK